MSQDSNQQHIDALRHQWQAERTPRLTLQLAEEYRQSGDPLEAIAVLRAGLESHPGHTASRVALGRYLLENGQPQEACGALEPVTAEDQTHLVANKLLVGCYLELGRLVEATNRLDLYRLLNAGDPDIEELESQLAALSDGGVSVAADDDSELVSKEPQGTGTVVDQASFEDNAAEGGVQSGGEEAVGAFGSAESSTESPRGPDAQDGGASENPFGDLWANGGRDRFWDSIASGGIFEIDRTPEPVAQAPVPSPASSEEPAPDSTVTLGRLYLEQGHRQEARRVFSAVLEREPDNALARAGLTASEGSGDWNLTALDLVPARLMEGSSLPRRQKALLESYLARLRPKD